MIPCKAPVWLLDHWRYEAAHEVHVVFMEKQFIRFLYNVKGFPKRQKIVKALEIV